MEEKEREQEKETTATRQRRREKEGEREREIERKRRKTRARERKKRCSWDSLPPHYSVCSSISRREMAKARAPLFLWAFDNPRRYLSCRRGPPRLMCADSRGCHLSAASQLPLLCHLAFVYRISNGPRTRAGIFYRVQLRNIYIYTYVYM